MPRCLIEKLKDGLIDPADPKQRRRTGWEVFAPAGFQFDASEHSKLAWSLREARAVAKEPLKACSDDCHCKESDE